MKTMYSSKFSRSVMCFVLAFVMLLGMHTTAHATISGTETWSKESDSSPEIKIYDTNLTPRKTMGKSGNVKLWFIFSPADNPNYRVQINVEARNLTTGQTKYFTLYPYINNDQYLTVSKGEVYQFYFDVCTFYEDPAPGYKRSAYLQYGYVFS